MKATYMMPQTAVTDVSAMHFLLASGINMPLTGNVDATHPVTSTFGD